MITSAEFLLFLLAAFTLGAIAYAFAVTCWRMLHDDGRLRLRRLLARAGTSLDAAPASDCEKARAARTCVACGEKARCDAWLASHRREGYAAFCPNALRIASWSRS
ncbi:MAG: DUF6455 family protein [Burkholderiales bacterium]